MLSVLGAIALMNTIAFGAFGYDKRQAKRGGWRIPEGQLLLLATLGGWLGAKLGQMYFRHKTQKLPFKNKLNAIPFLYALIFGPVIASAGLGLF